MRVGVINGNGCCCNMCHAVLEPKEAIKVKFTKLSSDLEKASTGWYETLGKADLCEDCYNKISELVGKEKPRK